MATIRPIDEVRNNRKSVDEKEEILGAYIKAKERSLKALSVDAPSKPAAKATAKPSADEVTPKKKSSIAEEEEEEDTTPKKKKLSSLNDDDEDN